MKYVYKNMRGVLDIQSSDLRGTAFILFYRGMTDGSKRYGMAWLEWADGDATGFATPIQVGY